MRPSPRPALMLAPSLALMFALLLAPATLAQDPDPDTRPGSGSGSWSGSGPVEGEGGELYDWVCISSGGYVYAHRPLLLGFCELRLCWLESERGRYWPFGSLRALFPEYVCRPLYPLDPSEPSDPGTESGPGFGPPL